LKSLFLFCFGYTDLYLKGISYLNRGPEEGYKKAMEYFEQAIEKDPTYAQAYAGLTFSYAFLGFLYLPPKEAFPKAKAAAMKTLEIDDTLAEAHTSLALVRAWYDWDWLGAEREYKRALSLSSRRWPRWTLTIHRVTGASGLPI
jgi:serine/threonine-protein kinase